MTDEIHMFSGGAKGADRFFTLFALENGHTPINYSFEGAKTHVRGDTIVCIQKDILSHHDITSALKMANKRLNRQIPVLGSYVYNLLARNYFQIITTTAVYALSKITSPSKISGGTAWATQMYIDRCIAENIECNLYVFDLLSGLPHKFDINKYRFVEVNQVPFPVSDYTGIGSRETTAVDFDDFKSYFTKE